jgi:hypothetical protein
MGLKEFNYYNEIGMDYPDYAAYSKVYVYNKGKVVVNGTTASMVPASVLADYKKQGFTVETSRDTEAYNAARREYGQLEGQKNAEFRDDLFDEHGVTGNPRAQRCYDIAWSYGHSSGLQEVANYFSELVDLIK